MAEKLALHGGEKAKTVPFSKGKRFDGSELKYLQEALEQMISSASMETN